MVSNQDLIKYIDALLFRRESSIRSGVHFEWVKGHAGTHGNEEADRLANEGAVKSALPDRDYAALAAEIRGPARGPMDAFVRASAAAPATAPAAGASEAAASADELGGGQVEDWMLADAAELEDEVNGL